MTWHYAAGGVQHGPVDDAELDRLIAAGAVTGDTLVWHAGLEGWRPLREARPQALLAEAAQRSAASSAASAAASSAAASSAAASADAASADAATSVPASSDTASSAATPIAATSIAATPIAAQPRPRPDADAEFARVAGRRLAPVSAIQRGMALVFAQPGPTIGISALIMVLMMVSGFVPCVGSIVQLAVIGPLTAAWYGYFLRHIRRQPASMEDVFAVFSSPDLLHMIAVHVVVTVISLIVIVPFIAAIFVTMIGTAAATAAAAEAGAPAFSMGPLAVVPFLVFLPVMAAMLYLHVAFMFALPLIHDRGHAFWPAMRLSQRVVHRQLLPMVGLVLLGGLVALAGVLALCLGIFVALPIVIASNAYAYEDLFGEAGATSTA